MTDRGPLHDQNETPEDVATLYSWANLHGAKYRDFSASRAQTREKARLRVQQAIEEEQARANQLSGQQSTAESASGTPKNVDAARAEEEARQAQLIAQHTAQHAARQAAQLAAEQAAHQVAHQAEAAKRAAAEQAAAQHEAEEQAAAQQAAAQQAAAEQAAAQRAAEKVAAQQAAERVAAQQAEAARQAAQQAARQAAQQAARQAAQQAAWHQPLADRFPVNPTSDPMPPAEPNYPSQFDFQGYAPPQPQRPVESQQERASMREESNPQSRNPWAPVDSRENAGRPAWLTTDRPEPAAQAAAPQAPDDTLQGSRDRMTSRWFALRGLFDGGESVPVEAAPIPVSSRAPVVAIFSLAGGVGKTSLVATLGRALSARGERILLVDTAPFGLLPFFFGARDQRPGLLRTFSPPGASGDTPIQLVTIDPEDLGPENAQQEVLTGEIATYARGVSRVIVDLATASGATTRRVMKMAPLVLVPMIPDMNSVVSVSSIDSFFQHNGGGAGKPALPSYVLNQFDPSLPLHLDIREVLREQLGDRLLPFVLRRAPAVSEALAEGMTVMDYAPNSTVAEDFGTLASWVKSQSAPASSTYRGVRWSER
jgi:cellulose synthase operon protein YhjQ